MKFDDKDNLIDIKVFVPYIIDINTAKIYVHELKHAYDLYLKLGTKIDEIEKFETDAIKLENEFEKQYKIHIRKGKI